MERLNNLKEILKLEKGEEIHSGTLYRKNPPKLQYDVLVL
jgi:hypothetical protein